MSFQMASVAVLTLSLLLIPAARSRHKSDGSLMYDDLPQTTSLQSTPECTFTKFTSHVPSAARHSSDLWNLDMLYRMKATGVVNEDKCAEMCCDFGPDCQYAWLYESDCYAVNCSSDLESFCEPYSSSKFRPSTYIQVRRTGNPLSSDNDYNYYQGGSVEKGGKTHQVVPSVTVASPPESSSVTFSAPVSVATIVSEHMPSSTVLPAMKMPLPPTSATSVPPVEPHKPPEEEEKPVQDYLTVAVDGNKKITLPDNTVEIFASAWPKSEPLRYRWEKVFGPNEGALSGINQDSVTLSGLTEGKYGLKVTVHDAKDRHGEAYVNITVLPEAQGQKSPMISISPSTEITFSLPTNSAILDASETTGQGTLSFHWEVIDKPIQDIPAPDGGWDQSVLKLQGLQAGSYKFRLTVTDGQKATSSSDVTVTVLPEQDYPPTANAGDPILIHLPKNEVTLSGKKSSDDKGIVKYKWEMVEGKQAEPSGIKTPTLHVKNLDLGLYQFKLTVTDTIGQTDTATVSVDVLPESNEPPIVVLSQENLTVTYPVTSAVVNGSSSYDDYRIDSYWWMQDEGPTDIVMNGRNTSILMLDDLHIQGSSPTVYRFTLTIFDYANLNSSESLFLYYYKDKAVLPLVSAGPDVTITFPTNTAIINGSLSLDGFGIKSYHWSRSGDSPAAGRPVEKSDSTDILIISDLVTGQYNFTLEVVNNNGVKNSDTVTLTVNPDPNRLYLVQVLLDADIYRFSQNNLDVLAEQLVIAMETLDYRTVIQRLFPQGPNILVEFYMVDGYGRLVNATVIVNKLSQHGQDFMLQQFHIVGVETTVCQSTCSGQGTCDQRTKRCECNAFWVENPIKANFGKKISNCDWSLLYVILSLLVGVFFCGLVCWLCCCYCCVKRRRAARRRKVKYAILDNPLDEGDLRGYPNSGRYCKTSLMHSDTETEEEVLYDSHKKQEKNKLMAPNNLLRNNISPPGRLNNSNSNGKA